MNTRHRQRTSELGLLLVQQILSTIMLQIFIDKANIENVLISTSHYLPWPWVRLINHCGSRVGPYIFCKYDSCSLLLCCCLLRIIKKHNALPSQTLKNLDPMQIFFTLSDDNQSRSGIFLSIIADHQPSFQVPLRETI